MALIRRVMALVVWVHSVEAYELGADTPICWATLDSSSEPQREDCNGTDVRFLSGLETFIGSQLYVSTYYEFLIEARIPPSRGAVVRNYAEDKNERYRGDFDVSHGNVHMCLDSVGFCTPFVQNTPGLSTHSAEARCLLNANGTCTLSSRMQFDALQTYTAIAHVRWYDAAGVKHDIARARLAVAIVPAPETAAQAEARLSQCHALRETSLTHAAALVNSSLRSTLAELTFIGGFETWFDQSAPKTARLISSITLSYTILSYQTNYRDSTVPCSDLVLPDLISDQPDARTPTLLAVNYKLTSYGAAVSIRRKLEFWLTIDPTFFPFDVQNVDFLMRSSDNSAIDGCSTTTLTAGATLVSDLYMP